MYLTVVIGLLLAVIMVFLGKLGAMVARVLSPNPVIQMVGVAVPIAAFVFSLWYGLRKWGLNK